MIIRATDTVRLAGSGLFSVTEGDGDAGPITLQAPHVRLTDGALIATFTTATGSGRAGDMRLSVGTLRLTGGSQLTSSTSGSMPGGVMQVTASDSIFIAGQDQHGLDSGLFNTTSDGSGHAGSITIRAPTVRLEDMAKFPPSPLTRVGLVT